MQSLGVQPSEGYYIITTTTENPGYYIEPDYIHVGFTYQDEIIMPQLLLLQAAQLRNITGDLNHYSFPAVLHLYTKYVHGVCTLSQQWAYCSRSIV